MYSRIIGDVFDESHPSTWKLTQLEEAFRALGNQTSSHLKICFLIDGLDEFDGCEGDYDEMGQLLKDIASSRHIKVCLSSRPWVVFSNIFCSCPNLKLQDLTYRDIEKYVQDKFYRNSALLELANRELAVAPALMKEIFDRADGVFIWVKLVVRSLLNGLQNRDEATDL